MDLQVFQLLLRDSLTTGAIYALLGVAIVLVFAVTRVLFVPQGEFVAFAALSLVAFEEGRVPGLAGLLLTLAVLAGISRLLQERNTLTPSRALRIAAIELGPAAAVWSVVHLIAPLNPGPLASIPLTLTMVVLMGTAIYRIIFQPLAEASVLVLLIAAFGMHMMLLGLGLYFFGPEGFQTQPLIDASFPIGSLRIKVHDLIVLATAAVLMAAMTWFFARFVTGKALRASAVNRIGASLVGIPTERTGLIAFALAAAIGAVSGVLVGPVTTIYYDTGFMIGLKGLAAAVLGGLVSYLFTVLAALALAIVEAAASFWASSYKEVLVFLLILPVLLWRSLAIDQAEFDDED